MEEFNKVVDGNNNIISILIEKGDIHCIFSNENIFKKIIKEVDQKELVLKLIDRNMGSYVFQSLIRFDKINKNEIVRSLLEKGQIFISSYDRGISTSTLDEISTLDEQTKKLFVEKLPYFAESLKK